MAGTGRSARFVGRAQYLDDLDASRARYAHHVSGAAPAGKRDDEIGPPFIEHALVPNRSRPAAEAFPVGVIDSARHAAATAARSSAAVNQARDFSPG